MLSTTCINVSMLSTTSKLTTKVTLFASLLETLSSTLTEIEMRFLNFLCQIYCFCPNGNFRGSGLAIYSIGLPTTSTKLSGRKIKRTLHKKQAKTPNHPATLKAFQKLRNSKIEHVLFLVHYIKRLSGSHPYSGYSLFTFVHLQWLYCLFEECTFWEKFRFKENVPPNVPEKPSFECLTSTTTISKIQIFWTIQLWLTSEFTI